MLRPRYAPRTLHGSASRAHQSFAEPTGKRAVRFPVGLRAPLSLSSRTSGVDTLLDLLTQEMIAQYHFAGPHPGNGFDAPPDLVANTGGEFGRTQWTGQVKMHRHLTIDHLHLVQQPQFAKRTSNLRVARRARRGPHGIKINLRHHRVGVPAIPVSWAVLAYSRLRWAISSFSISLSLLSISMP